MGFYLQAAKPLSLWCVTVLPFDLSNTAGLCNCNAQMFIFMTVIELRCYQYTVSPPERCKLALSPYTPPPFFFSSS